MSRSSLWVMDSNFNGLESIEYRNSWWFSPVVWDVLLDKYMHDDIQTPYGYKKSLIGFGSEGLDRKLNESVNNCDNFADRICWELSNQQVFFTKDKKEIAQAIKDFAKNNTRFHICKDEGVSVLTFGHIVERFEKIANDILEVDEKEYPNFIFKNTSVDDGVEYWFEKYDEESEEYSSESLKKLDKMVTEFVVIEDGKIKEFVNNLKYFTA